MPPIAGPDPRRPLDEFVRQAERIIDQQLQAMSRLDDKSAEIIRFGVATLAGGIALAALALQNLKAAVDPAFFAQFASAGGLNVFALLFELHAYAGFRRHPEPRVGPRIDWLLDTANDPTWSPERHQLSILATLKKSEHHNVGEMARSALWRRRGLLALLGSVLVYTTAFFYILGRTILQ